MRDVESLGKTFRSTHLNLLLSSLSPDDTHTNMSPSKFIKIAIVGTGLIGPRHAEAIINEPSTVLACIVDPSPAAEAVAEKLKCALYKSVKAMLASSDKPDAALVCTPNHTHVSISKELLEGGVHVLCEKPISVDVASGQELVNIPKS